MTVHISSSGWCSSRLEWNDGKERTYRTMMKVNLNLYFKLRWETNRNRKFLKYFLGRCFITIFNTILITMFFIFSFDEGRFWACFQKSLAISQNG